MKRAVKFLLSMTMAVLLTGCTDLGMRSGTSINVKGRLLDDVYISPSGSFRVKVPRLLQPGASIRDEVASDGNVSVRFADDLCRFFGVQEVSGPVLKPGQLEELVIKQENARLEQVGATAGQPRRVNTDYGEAVWLSYQHPAGAPCQRLEIDAQGKRLKQPDADVDLVVLYAGGRYYRLLHVRAQDVGMPVAGFTGSGEDAFKALLDSLVVVKQ